MRRVLAAAAVFFAIGAVAPATALATGEPAGPTGIALDARVELAWQPVTGAGSYNVYRGTTPTAITTQIATGVLTSFYTDSTAANGTAYYYVVRSVTGGVESGDSLVVQSTPKARSCATGNDTRLENCYPGDSAWTLQNQNAPSGIDGFATAASINKGESVDLKISTDSATGYRMEIFRTGFYGNAQARLYSVVRGLQGSTQPSCTTDGPTGLVDCSNWSRSATITTTPSWPSGVYLIRLVRDDNSADNHLILVVRDDARHSQILYGTGISTYQAYNSYGGKSLYDFNSTGATTVAGTARAVKVSFDRPFAQSRGGGHNWFTLHEHSWVSWLEEQSYDVAYQADTDMERNGIRVRDHNVYMLAPHDEYYSSAMRTALEQARDGGTDIFSTGANQVYWKIRFENGPGGGQDRIEVCYKSTQSGGPDPSSIPTGTWRDPAGANRPENALLGAMYVGDNDQQDFPLVVTAAQGADPIYRGTSLATQSPGTQTSVGTSLVGWEWDARVANGSEPAGVTTLSSSPVSGNLIQNNGANGTPGSTTANTVKYKAAIGSLVFSTGTNQWYKGLAATTYALAQPDVRIQQTTLNVLTDMGVTPETPAAGLTVIPTPPGGGGGDPGGGTSPTVTEKIPADGATQVSSSSTVRAVFSTDMNASTITASSFTLAPASGGASLAATVSYDAPSRTATLTTSSPLALGTTYRSSLSTAIQSSTNVALPATSWTFTTFTCPCRLFPATAAPVSLNNPTQDGRTGSGPWSYELGVKVTVTQPMQVRGLSFWKTSQERGVHTGKIWDGTGATIAQAEFATETASGWQYQPLASAVTLQPGQTYTVSVNANDYFAFTSAGLASQVNSGPLQTVVGGNGVFGSAAGVFPNQSFNTNNYFVDVEVVDVGTTVAPSVTAVTPRSLSATAPPSTTVTATFSVPMTPASITGTTFTLTGPSGAVAGSVTYDSATRTARLTPSSSLANAATYTATLASSISDTAGHTLGSPASWTFTTTSACVCTLFSPTLTPVSLDNPTQDGRVGPGPWSREFGVVINVVRQTRLTAFRYYRTPAERGSHTGKLWANGALVTQAVFTTESASGWQHQALATPVVLNPGTNYTISVNANDYFAFTSGGLASQVSAGSAQTLVGQNGVFSDAAGLLPTQSFGNANYFVDLQVADDTLEPPPAPTDATPHGGDVQVAVTSPVRVTFSRAMTASTITSTSFTLTRPGGATVAASVTYDAPSKTATLTPTAPLDQATTYTANLATSIQASDGTPLANAIAWSFTTIDSTPPDTTISSSATNPTNSANATFAFSSDDPTATFECALDGAAFAACTSPKTYSGLTDASHTFQVRGKDPAGNVDLTPASFTWSIDTVAPDTTITSAPASAETSTNATFTFSSTEPTGATFSCSLDGAAAVPCVSGVSYSGLAGGSHTFTVAASDQVGNADATPATHTWTIDVTPPDTTITSGPSSLTTATSATFAFTSTKPAGGTFECVLDGGAATACTSPQTYAGPLADGAHTFQVTAIDSGGRRDPTPATLGWTIDTAGPATSITASPANPSNSTSASFSFSSEAGATFQCSLDGAAFGTCTSPQAYSALGQGSHTFHVKGTDLAGNTGAESSFTWTIDTVAPTVTITTSPANPSSSSAPSFGFNSEAGATFQCALDAAAFAACTSPTSYTAVADGSHTFQVKATDAAGNTGTAASVTWTIDSTAPTAAIDSSPTNPSSSSAASFTFSSEAGATFECAMDAGAFAACTSPKSYTGLAEGPHTFQVRAKDAAGNTGSAVSSSWTIDTTAPDTTIGTQPSNPSSSGSASFTFSSEAGSSFECALDGAAYGACSSPQGYTALADGSHTFQVRAKDVAGNTDPTPAAYTWTIDTLAPDTTIATSPSNASSSGSASFGFSSEAGATFECAIDAGAFAACTSPKSYTGLVDGSHSFQVRAKDAAGNTDATPASFSWTIDTTAPDTTITASPAAATNSGSASFSFSSEAGATFECALDGAAYAACTSPNAYTGLADGSHTFNVRAKDATGNADATPAGFTWTIDTTAPETTITASPSSPSNSANASFSFSSEAGASFECALDGAAYAACTSPKSYAGLADGSHTFNVRAKDAAGNADATPASSAWTIDTAAPETTITTQPSSPSSSSSASFTFSSEAGASFECALDTGAYAACTSPKSYTGLSDGIHTFNVRAKDGAGNTDATPASNAWTIDTTAPDTTISSGPAASTNSSTAGFSFSSEAGATFECALDAGAYAACTSPQAYTGLTDGSHTFTVRAKDAAGNTDATPASATWTIDTTAPDTTISSSPSNPSNSANASFSFSSEAGASFECSLDAGAYAACTSPTSYTALADGSHTFTVRAKDAAGNTDATPASATWTIDTTAPDTTIGTQPSNSSSSSSADFSFSSEAGATFECALDAGAYATCTSPKSYTGLTDGSHTFSVRAKDVAGNTDATPASATWTIDTTAPDTTIGAGPSNPSNSAGASFSFNSEAGATFECALDGAAYAACTSPQSYTGLADGSHTFNVRAKDAAGNTDATAASSTWTIDTAAPDTTIGSSPANPSSSASASFTFSSEPSATFECALDGAAYAACTSPKSYTGLADGSHTFQVRAKDAAGNTDATPASSTWTIDTTAPDTTITASPSSPSNSANASFSFSSEAGATFECALDAGAYAACTSPKAYTGLTDGSHSFNVRAKDTAGNTDATPASATWTIDTTAPDTTITSGPAATTNSISASFSFSSEAGTTFECALDTGAYAACTSPKAYTGLSDGVHTFNVRAKDAAGNTDATPASAAWTIDTTAPDTTISTGPSNPSSSANASFSFTSEAGATFECSLDAGAYAACTSPKSYTALADGSHTFNVRAKDTAGNTDASPASATWTIDTTAPDTTITSGPAATSNSSSASFSFSSEAGATFECALDAGAYAACTSPKAYTGLTDGSHTFNVRAKDAAGNTDATPATSTWTIDTTAPDTTIGSQPGNPSSSTSASFSFSSEAGTTFECALDGAAYAACTSPKSYTGLADGSHTFQVRAKDGAGNTDATPASVTWTIDTTAPDTTISASPSNPSGSANASFSFTSEAGATFECALDTPTFTSCTSPQSYTALAAGSHTFQVRAKDAVGNVDASAASYTWTIDTAAPNTTITASPSNPSTSSSASFSFTATETPATFQCRIDAGAFAACSSPQTYAALADGSHTFEVRATDSTGNVDATPAAYTWTIDATAPNTTITSGPADPTTATTATFNFTSTETGSTFQCKLDAAAFAACTSPVAYSALALGSHTFQVRATDGAGNVDATPASQTWTIQNAAPTVTARTPAPGATGVATSTTVTATFSRAMDATTITSSSFTLTGPSGAVTATVSYNSGTNTATLTPSAALANGASYTANLATTIKAADGVALASPVSWSFTTVAASAPTVTSVTPPDGTTGVDRTYKPTATFSTDMNATTITTTSFTLKNSAGSTVAATVSYNSATKTATLSPTTSLQALVNYTARLETTIKSSTGVPLAAAYTWKFQTVAPKVKATYPNNSGGAFMSALADVPTPIRVAEISPWTPIEVEFTEPMDPATITSSSLIVTNDLGATVPGLISYDASTNTAVFTPATILSYGKTYNVQVLPTIAAVDGATLEAGWSWQFTVTTTGAPVGIDSGMALAFKYWTSSTNTLFIPDVGVIGGTARAVTQPITGTADPQIYDDERIGTYTYTIPVPDGYYDLRLHFAETEFAASGQRVFDVDIPQTPAAPDFRIDPFVSAGGANKAFVKTITNVKSTTITGLIGTIGIKSTAVTGLPEIAGIEIIPRTPAVTSKTPAAGATGVAKTSKVTAVFSTPMDATTLTTTTVTLKGPGGTAVPATVTYAAATKTVTLTPSAALAGNTTYTATLDATIKALAGLRLGAPVTWTFTTGP